MSKLPPLIAEARIHCVPNTLANMNLQGRHDTSPKRHGPMRVPELMALGVNVAFGRDPCLDPWYVPGNADMLDLAHMAVHAGPLTSRNALRAFGLERYGIAPGRHADRVLLEARDPIEAIRLRASGLAVVRRGAMVAETPPGAPSRPCRTAPPKWRRMHTPPHLG